MRTGVIFDIRDFTIHDGPGMRLTVFLKGCPLRCAWCHNPEGLSPTPQRLTDCTGEERPCGREYTSRELAGVINRLAEVLSESGGGVTFSGGEPLMQAPFVAETIDALRPVHVLMDTSGYGTDDDFRLLLERSDLVYFDLKLASGEDHEKWTGRDNTTVLRNLDTLSASGVPFAVRVPLVPGVTDTEENLRGIDAILRRLERRPLEIHLLPYNRAAGGKHKACGLDFRPQYDEDRPVNCDSGIFSASGFKVSIAGGSGGCDHAR